MICYLKSFLYNFSLTVSNSSPFSNLSTASVSSATYLPGLKEACSKLLSSVHIGSSSLSESAINGVSFASKILAIEYASRKVSLYISLGTILINEKASRTLFQNSTRALFSSFLVCSRNSIKTSSGENNSSSRCSAIILYARTFLPATTI